MEYLKNKIKADGKLIGNSVLKVDSFLNHQLEPLFIQEIGREIARRYQKDEITKILTIEASGIAVALIVGLELGVPVIFAKKKKPLTMDEGYYSADVYSFTKEEHTNIAVSKAYLSSTDKVLIVDDFLAMGAASKGLVEIVRQADASLAGIGIVVEKAFQGGGEELRTNGIRVESLAKIQAFQNGEIIFD